MGIKQNEQNTWRKPNEVLQPWISKVRTYVKDEFEHLVQVIYSNAASLYFLFLIYKYPIVHKCSPSMINSWFLRLRLHTMNRV